MKSKLIIAVLFIFFCLAQNTLGQDRNLTISQLQDSVKSQPKPTMLLIHTDWCTYCAMQKQQLKSNNELESVYLAEFNAEQKEDVHFNGELYRFKPTGRNIGTHELVKQLVGDKKISYPLWIILDKQLNVVDSYAGYLRPEEFNGIVQTLSEE